jgi:hypothetical protein
MGAKETEALVPSIAAAQSHVPPRPSERNQVSHVSVASIWLRLADTTQTSRDVTEAPFFGLSALQQNKVPRAGNAAVSSAKLKQAPSRLWREGRGKTSGTLLLRFDESPQNPFVVVKGFVVVFVRFRDKSLRPMVT